ncbi:hypothetical protein A3K92_08320 [Thermococcus gorgonarius]|uniref:Uncharacterized protein n=2 Tax=Thermococcus gorgonarius TaxID=71997 RepID=A0A2Z2MAE8_THEGO|nr:hypothetical protein A3K92_08320 [Thermococcus gorgonarius]
MLALIIVTAVLLSLNSVNVPKGVAVSDANVTFSHTNLILFGGIYLITVAVFTYHLGRRGEYADVLYIMVVSLLVLWALNSQSEPAGLQEELSNLIGRLNLHLKPSPEGVFYLYVYASLLLATSTFYIAPRHSRELGFLIFGMTFSMPLFREFITSTELVGIAAFSITLALSSSFFSYSSPLRAGLEGILLAISTVIVFSVRPIAVLIPVALILTFPRKKRNLLYLALALAGFLVVQKNDLWLRPNFVAVPLEDAIIQLLLPTLLFIYLTIGKSRAIRTVLRNTRGPTPFLIFLTVAYAVGFVYDRTIFPYLLLLISSVSTRIIYQVRNLEKGTAGARAGIY